MSESDVAAPADHDHLQHIASISQSAMSVWYALLGAVVFGAVTLLGHRDADFFAVGAETTLPLLGVAAPTETVFYGLPLGVLALYAYLHAALLKLWRALSTAPDRLIGAGGAERRLDEAIFPFLFSDAALRWRASRFRQPLGFGLAFAAWAFGWALAPALLIAFWIRSMPAHEEGMTLFLGALLWTAVMIGWTSRAEAKRLMRGRDAGLIAKIARGFAGALLALVIGVVSWSTTEAGLWAGDGETPIPQNCSTTTQRDGLACFLADLRRNGDAAFLAPAALDRAEITAPPAGFAPRELAVAEFRRAAIARRVEEFGPDWRRTLEEKRGGWAGVIAREVEQARAAQRTLVGSRDLSGADLRRASLRGAMLVNARLEGARFDEADLAGAWLEGAALTGARFPAASLTQARLESALMADASFQDAALQGARLERSLLFSADFTEASLIDADLAEADLSGARLVGAALLRTRLEGAELDGAILNLASLAGASLIGAKGLNDYALSVSFGDAATLLPEGLTRPQSWDRRELDFLGHGEAYSAWRAAQKN